MCSPFEANQRRQRKKKPTVNTTIKIACREYENYGIIHSFLFLFFPFSFSLCLFFPAEERVLCDLRGQRIFRHNLPQFGAHFVFSPLFVCVFFSSLVVQCDEYRNMRQTLFTVALICSFGIRGDLNCSKWCQILFFFLLLLRNF